MRQATARALAIAHEAPAQRERRCREAGRKYDDGHDSPPWQAVRCADAEHETAEDANGDQPTDQEDESEQDPDDPFGEANQLVPYGASLSRLHSPLASFT